MEDYKRMSLFIRQLIDVISQGDKILRGEKNAESIENYARYSNELKQFISVNIKDEKILELNDEIPIINYKRLTLNIWQYLLLPYWFILIYIDYIAMNKTLREIDTSRGKFSSIEFLSHSLINKDNN